MAKTLVLRMDPTATEASWQLVENGQLVGSDWRLHQRPDEDAGDSLIPGRVFHGP